MALLFALTAPNHLAMLGVYFELPARALILRPGAPDSSAELLEDAVDRDHLGPVRMRVSSSP